jgi:hypothetical protein
MGSTERPFSLVAAPGAGVSASIDIELGPAGFDFSRQSKPAPLLQEDGAGCSVVVEIHGAHSVVGSGRQRKR